MGHTVGNDFAQIEGVQHLTGPCFNVLNKLQNLELKSPREGGLNSAKNGWQEWFTGKAHSKKTLQQFWYKRSLVLLTAYKIFVISVLCSLQCQVLESCELPGNETTQCVLRKVSCTQNYGFAADSGRWLLWSPCLFQKYVCELCVMWDMNKMGCWDSCESPFPFQWRELPVKHIGIAAHPEKRQNELEKTP